MTDGSRAERANTKKNKIFAQQPKSSVRRTRFELARALAQRITSIEASVNLRPSH